MFSQLKRICCHSVCQHSRIILKGQDLSLFSCHQYFCHQHFCCHSQNFYKSKRIKPQNSKIILDGNDSRSCLNPLPNGQTGKLYQTDDLEGWRQFARSYMLQTSPKWDPKDKNNQKKGTGTAQVNFQTPKLKAKEKCENFIRVFTVKYG